MYIVYKGNCEVFNHHDGVLAQVHERMVIGESAIQKPKPTLRTASARVISAELVCFKLSKEAYHSILSDLNLVRKAKRYKYLKNVLKHTPSSKLYDINTAIAEISYTAGETIYNMGHDTSAFYMVKDGAVLLETLIEIDAYFKIPVKTNEWDVRK